MANAVTFNLWRLRPEFGLDYKWNEFSGPILIFSKNCSHYKSTLY